MIDRNNNIRHFCKSDLFTYGLTVKFRWYGVKTKNNFIYIKKREGFVVHLGLHLRACLRTKTRKIKVPMITWVEKISIRSCKCYWYKLSDSTPSPPPPHLTNKSTAIFQHFEVFRNENNIFKLFNNFCIMLKRNVTRIIIQLRNVYPEIGDNVGYGYYHTGPPPLDAWA